MDIVALTPIWLSSLQRALGVNVEFVEIDRDNKIMELDAKKHRLGVWNGDDDLSEVKNGTSVSKCLPQNTQVVELLEKKS